MAEYHAIDTAEEYARSIELLMAGSGPVAVDAERASGYRYSQRAYLIQLFRRGSGVFLFDPPALGRLDTLQDALAGEEWVLHAASQDLSCLREVGLDPQRLFDTELGARLLGLPRVGLGTVVDELLGVHLAKEHSAADWSKRPLPQPWLVYAALDVELLVDLRDEVGRRLAAAGKMEIAQQEFDAELASAPKPPRAEPWRRLSGIHSVKGLRNLAVARELWTARDRLARETDTAPGRLVPDSALTAVARALPASKHDLSGMKEFTGRASRSQLDRWWSAVEAGRTTDDLPLLHARHDTPPPARSWADRNPEADRRLRAARAAMGALSEERSIPVENLLTPSVLRSVAWEPPHPAGERDVAAALTALGARPWQVQATAEIIAAAFVEAAATVPDDTASDS